MSLGQDLGNQFLFGKYNPKSEVSSLGVGKYNPSGDLLGKEMSSIEVVDKLTENYYSSFSNLRNLAKTASKQYGIDVTAPDMSKDEEVSLNRLFLKTMAETKRLGNELKVGRDIQKRRNQALLTNPDAYAEQPASGEASSSESFGNLGLTVGDKEIAKYGGRSYNTGQEQEATQKEVDGYVKSLREELTVSEGTKAKALESRIKVMDRIRTGYTQNVSGRLRDSIAKAGKIKEAQGRLVELYTKTVLEAGSGNEITTTLKSLPNIIDAKYHFEDGKNVLKVALKKGGEIVDFNIDLSDSENGARGFSQVFKEVGSGYENVNIDEIVSELNLKQKEGDIKQSFSREESNYLESFIKGMDEEDGAKKATDLLSTYISKGNKIKVTDPKNGEEYEIASIKTNPSWFSVFGAKADINIIHTDGKTDTYDLGDAEGRKEFESLVRGNVNALSEGIFTQKKEEDDKREKERIKSLYKNKKEGETWEGEGKTYKKVNGEVQEQEPKSNVIVLKLPNRGTLSVDSEEKASIAEANGAVRQ